jgi:glycosyltransferase involved in cell wall biosynthesis
VKICVIYDCLFPWTIGGAERWYRNLAERLAAAGHEVTYLTLRQWNDDAPALANVKVVAVGPELALYSAGKRRIWPPVRFGLGVFLHLVRHGRDYDRVHTASFPFFSLAAAGLVRPWARYAISVDWHEVWSARYWRSYLGPLGIIGATIQRWCARIPQRAYSFSRLHLVRLQALGVNGPSSLLPGEYCGGADIEARPAERGLIVYAGRLIPEKRVDLLVESLAVAVREAPNLRAMIFGKGPDLPKIEAQVRALGLSDRVTLAGFAPQEVVDEAMCRATAVVQPSEREGYGMVVVEASARGVPAVVVAAEDNAATELVLDGVNGYVVSEATPKALAARLVDCIEQDECLRASTRAWYAKNAERLSIEYSIGLLVADLGVGRC